MYRNLFSDMEQKNKQLEDDTSRAQEQCVQLQQEKQSLVLETALLFFSSFLFF